MKTLLKKLLIIFSIIAIISIVANIANPQPVSAFSGSCRNFLGMDSWDCGVELNNENDLRNNTWTIAVNILKDITVIAAYLVIGYVIYGGYLYIFSGGEANKIATGKKALYQSFIGLAIIMTANIIMTAIRVALVGASGDIGSCATDSGCVSPDTMITNTIQWVIGIAGAISLIFIVYGGISYITSAGDPNKVQKAKSMILYALIGLAIVALAEAITAFVSSTIRNAAYYNQTIITKEIYEIEIN